ncbi:MAG: ribonuclease D [Acaryochloridaceae cyanobacterium RL_2_7]|nr:ribonuclease D [Acaryochloridaceae cyanobacterium RL_2_7]
MALLDFQAFDQDISDQVLADYLQCDRIAVDTETMGLMHHRDRLCLVQIGDRDGHITVVKIAQGQQDAPNLKKLMEADAVEKIFHFARFDIATMQYHLGILSQPIFCTKIASKLVRTYTSRHGLKGLVQELVGVDLDKSAQSSDWGNASNLSDEQLNYASNDVRYLIPARERLQMMLDREDRADLAQDCFNCLPTIVNLDLGHFEHTFEH